MFESLLSLVGITTLEYGYKIGLDWLGKFAQAVIEGVGIIGWGIVVFTLVLKAITLPFDIYQRVKMRKQNLIMREMQPELEKLQKQYANDKNMYNQKMMELYKKNGYSLFGACLPMILSLVILIVAFQGFRTYSQYANLAMYEKMSQHYSEEIISYAPMKDFGDGRTYFVLAGEGEEEKLEEGKIRWEDGRVIDGAEAGNPSATYRLYKEGENRYVEVSPTEEAAKDKFLLVKYWIDAERVSGTYSYYADSETFAVYMDAHGEEAFYQNRKEGEENPTKKQVYEAIYDAATDSEKSDNTPIIRYMVKVGAAAAADWYREDGNAGFLWVKNVWYADVVYEHPIQTYAKFSKQFDNKKITLTDGTKTTLTTVLGPSDYENLTLELSKETSAPNGYFILIILSIGFMVLSQFISMRSSKESNKYQTVNGQGAKTQKIMLVVMPLIYAVFAFMYSAAFSIYMTMSSVISLATTLLANLVIGRIFKKKEEAQIKDRVTRKYDWQLTEKEKKEKEKRAEKEKKQQQRANRFNRKN